MIIRDARLQDSAELQQLLLQMGSIYDRTIQEIEDRILAFNREGHQLLVVEENHKILGMIAFGCYQQFRLQGCCCHIDTLVVDQNVRHQGVGKILLLRAEQYAHEHGATEIELTTANHRKITGTHAFYKAQGYQDHLAIDCSYFVKKGRS